MATLSITYEDDLVRVAGRVSGGYQVATESLEEGVVAEGKILNPARFQSAIRQAFTSAQLRLEPNARVAVAIPEQRVFTKLLQIPKVSRHEVDEAVYWAARGALPSDPNRLAIDYQLISSDQPDQYRALVVATPRELVEGIWTTLVGIGLIPETILPTSAGLAQITYTVPNVPELLISSDDAELLSLIVTKNRTARFSTSIALADRAQIKQSIIQAIRFYEARDGKGRQIGSILVLPGSHADDLIALLSQAPAILPVHRLHSVSRAGERAAHLDDYLANVGLLMATPSLNLILPEQRQLITELQIGRWLRHAWRAEVALALLMVGVTAAALASRSLEGSRQSPPSPLTAAQRQDLTIYRALEAVTKSQPTLQAKRSHFAEHYQQIQSALNPEIQLVAIASDPKQNLLLVTGQRGSRDGLEQFVRALQEHFADVYVPTSNWADATGGVFTMELH